MRTAARFLFVQHARGTSLLLTVTAAVGIWLVFYPAIVPSDGTSQYAQAVTGNMNSWHPPIMSGALRLLMRCGLDIGSLMLIQCLAGALGLWTAALWEIELLCNKRSAMAYWAATAITFAILSPLTPMAFYCVTFWKDSWTAILLVWVLGMSLRLFYRAPDLSRRSLTVQFVALVGVMILAGLPRHNTLTVAPVMGMLLWAILARANVRLAWLSLVVPIVGMVIAEQGLERLLHVFKARPDNQVKAVDLVGIYVLYPELRSEIPYTSAAMRDGICEHFRLGEMGTMAWGHPETVSDDYRMYLGGHVRPLLDAEYVQTWKTHPFAMIVVKFQAFRRIIGVRRYYFHTGIDPNPYGLRQNDRFLAVRTRYHRAALDMMDILPISWLSHHLFWFIVNLVALVAAGWRMSQTLSSLSILTAVVLLMPICYTLGFALAMTGVDYRFLLPSTLLMQVMGGGWLAALALRRQSCDEKAPLTGR